MVFNPKTETNMKILINTTPLNKLGGVSNHFKGLKPYWSKDVRYFCIGVRKWRTVFFFYYLTKYILCLLFYRPDVVVLNPSMAKKAIKRDFTYMNIAELFHCQVVIMFHGFHVVHVAGMEQEIVAYLNRCSFIYVLSENFRKILESWGVSVPILLTTTKVSDDLVSDFDIKKRIGGIKNVLFLARTTREKGVFVALDVFRGLSVKYPDLYFSVVGNGKDLKEAKEWAQKEGVRIRFTGELNGKSLQKEFENADVYLFTSYHEGMPTSVLEAMAFGLPVITRPVGGLTDFFENGKMGFTVDSDIADDYMEAFDNLISNKCLCSDISKYNYNYARKHFLASQIAPKMEDDIKRYVKIDK